jgi:uncharacterized protein YprB with RNaseH-like and TPR domain
MTLGGDALRDRLSELVRRRRTGTFTAPAPLAPEALTSGTTALPESSASKAATPRRRKATSTTPAPLASRPRPRSRKNKSNDASALESFLPGGEWRHAEHGAVYVHERLRSEVETPRAHWGHLPEPATGELELSSVRSLGLERAIFLDLETCGLSSCPVFLAGTMVWNGTDFVFRQYFARHYGEEAALVAAVAEQARHYELLITFNGKSYDAPFLRARATTHDVDLTLPRHHLDLVHHARRRWRVGLPDCRLTTLERRICKRVRTGDVAGAEIPPRYHDYVRTGDPWPLVPVFHHNLLDVTAMADILDALCRRDRGGKPTAIR